MSDIDEQLKVVQLRKAQLELDQLLLRRKIGKAIIGLPIAVIQLIVFAALATLRALRRHARMIFVLLLVAFIGSVAFMGHYIWRQEQEALAKQRAKARIDEAVEKACAQEIANYALQCAGGQPIASDGMPCYLLREELDRCRERARRKAHE